MRLVVLLLLLAAPLLELALLIKLGGVLGFWLTLALIIATAVVGTYLAQQQGMGVLQRMVAAASEGRPPVEPVMEGWLLFVAGALLISPGPIGDVLGALLLVPPLRALLARLLVRRMAESGGIFTFDVRSERWEDGRRDGDPLRPRRMGGTVIEGEYERIDEDASKPNGKKPGEDGKRGD